MYKKDFPMSQEYVMFDSAAIALKPRVMVDAINDFYLKKANNPHSKDSYLAKDTLEKIEETRDLVAKLVHSKAQEVIFTSGASHSINLLVGSIVETLSEEDNVIVFMDSHASGVIPWLAAKKKKGIKVLFVEHDEDVAKVVTPKTKALLVPQINNTTGQSHDVKTIFQSVKKVAPNCIVINDAAQGVVHGIVDFNFADAVVFSGMKLYGPTASGALVLKEELIDLLEPQEYGGGAYRRFDTQTWVPIKGYAKWEVGTQNIAGIIGLGASIKYVLNIGVKNIIQQEEKVSEHLFKSLEKIENIHIFSKFGSPTILFYIKRTDAHEIASELAKRNVLLRAGFHCAGIMGKVLNYEGATLRASLGLYNDVGDVDKLIIALKETLEVI